MIVNRDNDRPNIMKAILKVKSRTFLTPNYIRIILEGDDMAVFSDARIGDNNKILIPYDKNQQMSFPEQGNSIEAKTSMRTYTLRNLDIAKKIMTIDFVGHGENGPASKWATNAEPGDELGVFMKVKTKALFLASDWYFIIGDHTALPVISVLLESLPKDAKGEVIIEVFSEADVLDLKKPEKVTIVWKFNAYPGEKSELAAECKTENFPEGSTYVFAAAEYKTIAEIQEKLRNVPDLPRTQWQAYSYWKYGQAEDISSQSRREQKVTDR